MSKGHPVDENDPLAGAPDEVLAAFVALGGRAARLRTINHVTPASAARKSFEKMIRTAPAQNVLFDRKS